MNLARMRKRTTIALLVSLVFTVAILMTLFFSFTSLLFWAYVVPMPILLIAGQWNDSRSSLVLTSFERAKRSADGLGAKAWSKTGFLIAGVSDALTWPALLIAVFRSYKAAFRQKRSLQAIKTQFAFKIEYISRSQLYGSTFSLIATLLLFLPSLVLATRSAYTLRLMELLALSITFRHLATFWEPGGLLRIFKRTEGSPLAKFAAYSGFDLLALAVSLTYISAVAAGVRVSLHSLMQMLHRLVSLSSIIGKVPPGGFTEKWTWLRHMPLHQWIATIAGILLYFVVVQLFTNGLGQFDRSDDDFVALSVGLSVRNRYDEALQQLESVKSTNLARDARLTPLIEQGNIDKAAECARALISDDVRIQRVISPNDNDVFFLLISKSSLLSVDARVAVWNEAVAANVSPSLLVMTILSWKQNKEVRDRIFATDYIPSTRLARIAALLTQSRKPAAFSDWFPDEDVAIGENVFTEAALRIRTQVVLQSLEEGRLAVFDDWWNRERETVCQAIDALARKGEWGLALVIDLAELLRLTARSCKSTQESWWIAVREKAVKDFDAMRGHKGAAIIAGEIFAGQIKPQEWFE